MRIAVRLTLAVATVLLTAGPASADPAPGGGSSAGHHAAVTWVVQVFDTMSDAQRVGQLLMVDNPSTTVSATTLGDIRGTHVGSVILDGNSTLSVSAQRSVTDALRAATSGRAELFVATDQEGGFVRRLRGPGFSAIPSALVQGTWSSYWLQNRATVWGGQLRGAGVSVDLAPVMDTVPAGEAPNPPIGQLDREFGHTPAVVATHGVAVLRGLAAAGVVATVKHFPGLGRVTANTDTSGGVTDRITSATDPYLTPFSTAIRAGAPFMMVSTAIYPRIDPANPAAFSARIITGLLRNTLGFRGVVISDDLGAARQVSSYPVATRAIRFISAGGDIVLTVRAAQAAVMSTAILARMRTDPAFRAQVYAATLRVLEAKRARGLLR